MSELVPCPHCPVKYLSKENQERPTYIVQDMASHPPRKSHCANATVHAANDEMFPAMRQKSHNTIHGRATMVLERQSLWLLSTVLLAKDTRRDAKKTPHYNCTVG